jgi:DNA-binding GntR family transcriptional regulator
MKTNPAIKDPRPKTARNSSGRKVILLKSTDPEQRSVPSAIAALLREKILNGELPGGARIVESRVSGDFRVGQPTVREALFILERQGLVQRVANLGTFVTEMDVRDVKELYEIRKKLEGLAFGLAAERATRNQLAELDALAYDMKEAALKKGKRGYFESDLAFHRAVWEIADNRHLIGILEQIVVPLFAFSFLTIDRGRAELSEGANAHAKLLEALKKGPKQAQATCENVLESFLQKYFSHVLSGGGRRRASTTRVPQIKTNQS